MKKEKTVSIIPRTTKLSKEKLLVFFIEHLNRIYCAKQHLLNRLSELILLSHFTDLKQGIEETMTDVQNQILRMREIYNLLHCKYSKEQCDGLTSLVDEAYQAIKQQSEDAELRDMSILFYMENIESIETASFNVLRIVSSKLKDKQVEQLLIENYDESREDRALMLMILNKYVKG